MAMARTPSDWTWTTSVAAAPDWPKARIGVLGMVNRHIRAGFGKGQRYLATDADASVGDECPAARPGEAVGYHFGSHRVGVDFRRGHVSRNQACRTGKVKRGSGKPSVSTRTANRPPASGCDFRASGDNRWLTVVIRSRWRTGSTIRGIARCAASSRR